MKFATLSATTDGSASALHSGEASCLAQLEAAETQGYVAAWIGDASRSGPGLSPSQHVVAAALCARTSRLRIGVTSALEESLHPLRLAEEIAMLDVMSGGRFDWAIGPALPGAQAGSDSDESDSTEPWRTKPTPRRARVFQEQLAITLQALGGERFSHVGEFFQIPELQCFPAPIQLPHPPLWIRADFEASATWAQEAGLPEMTGAFTPASEVPRAAAPTVFEGALVRRDRLVVRHVHVGETDAHAREQAAPALAAMRGGAAAANPSGGDRSPVSGDCAIVGDAARCRDQLWELAEHAAPDVLVAWHGFGALPREAALASQRRLIEDVAPAFG